VAAKLRSPAARPDSICRAFGGGVVAGVSLRSARPGRRLLPVATFATARTGMVRLGSRPRGGSRSTR
jgi:hypothetical protein